MKLNIKFTTLILLMVLVGCSQPKSTKESAIALAIDSGNDGKVLSTSAKFNVEPKLAKLLYVKNANQSSSSKNFVDRNISAAVSSGDNWKLATDPKALENVRIGSEIELSLMKKIPLGKKVIQANDKSLDLTTFMQKKGTNATESVTNFKRFVLSVAKDKDSYELEIDERIINKLEERAKAGGGTVEEAIDFKKPATTFKSEIFDKIIKTSVKAATNQDVSIVTEEEVKEMIETELNIKFSYEKSYSSGYQVILKWDGVVNNNLEIHYGPKESCTKGKIKAKQTGCTKLEVSSAEKTAKQKVISTLTGKKNYRFYLAVLQGEEKKLSSSLQITTTPKAFGVIGPQITKTLYKFNTSATNPDSKNGRQEIELVWKAVARATSYKIYYGSTCSSDLTLLNTKGCDTIINTTTPVLTEIVTDTTDASLRNVCGGIDCKIAVEAVLPDGETLPTITSAYVPLERPTVAVTVGNAKISLKASGVMTPIEKEIVSGGSDLKYKTYYGETCSLTDANKYGKDLAFTNCKSVESLEVTGLTNGTAYKFYVVARVNRTGSIWGYPSAQVSGTPSSFPSIVIWHYGNVQGNFASTGTGTGRAKIDSVCANKLGKPAAVAGAGNHKTLVADKSDIIKSLITGSATNKQVVGSQGTLISDNWNDFNDKSKNSKVALNTAITGLTSSNSKYWVGQTDNFGTITANEITCETGSRSTYKAWENSGNSKKGDVGSLSATDKTRIALGEYDMSSYNYTNQEACNQTLPLLCVSW